ncbi:hypothetical protein [Caenispirillum bisanense]|uniref:hypothetical protein n=1 Tax=Caenispirillum bisanense TaxID=414052 RepID=UPI0031D863CB
MSRRPPLPLLLSLAAAAALLTACGGPEVASRQPDSLTLVVGGADELASAGEDAAYYCGQMGQGADLVETRQLDDGVIARFVCQ